MVMDLRATAECAICRAFKVDWNAVGALSTTLGSPIADQTQLVLDAGQPLPSTNGEHPRPQAGSSRTGFELLQPSRQRIDGARPFASKCARLWLVQADVTCGLVVRTALRAPPRCD